MKIVPYKQTRYDSCLVVCFLMHLKILKGLDFSKNDEIKLLNKGLERFEKAYYPGIILEFVKRYKLKLNFIIENRYLYEELKPRLENEELALRSNLINPELIDGIVSKNRRLILYLDNFYLGDVIHSPHFVLLEKRIRNRFVIIDPWRGRRMYLIKERLEEGIMSLRNHLKFSPVLIEL